MIGINDYTLGSGISIGGGKTNALNQFLTDVGDDSTGDDGVEDYNGGGGGGIKITQPNYVLNIKSNIKGAVVLINGEISNRKTPSQITISKQQLIESGDKTITLSKNGYVSNEKYVISLNTNGNTLVKSPIYNSGYGNISQTDISIKYYVNDIEQTYVQTNSTLKELSFTLSTKDIDIVEEASRYDLSVNVSGIDAGNAVLLRKNAFKSADMFPSIGFSKYSDVGDTKYNISSSDLSLYRILRITYYKESTPELAIDTNADDNESLTLDIKLSDNYVVDIVVENVVKDEPTIKPQIELLKTDSRTYNINSEIGVPIAFRKNEAVKAITIIVGDDILEFDDLEVGEIAGVTIPHNVFEKIGKYNIKIFPFSLNDYEDDITPKIPKPTIRTKTVNNDYIITETKDNQIKQSGVSIKPKDNPYVKPLPTYSGINLNLGFNLGGFGRLGVLPMQGIS